MPPKAAPKCCKCQGTESLLWRTVELGQICQVCYEQNLAKTNADANTSVVKNEDKDREKEAKETAEIKPTTPEEKQTTNNKSLRKSTRSTRFKSKAAAASNASANTSSSTVTTKSQSKRNRRSLFKKAPLKLPLLQASTHYSESLFYKGSYLQVGDIVSLVDKEENVYYAQIRGLLTDAYCEKSAYLTWLIPTTESPDPREKFDPATYLIGYDEDFPRKLSYLEFVMHAPSNYYYDRTQPFPLPDMMDTETKKGAYIWTRLPGWERQRT